MYKIISEVVNDDIKSKLGQRIIKLFDLLGKNKSIEFTLSSGTKIVLKCVKAANTDFEFEILLDDKKALCKWDNLQLTLKIGNKNDKNVISKYELNKNIFEPSKKDENGFTLKFKGSNKKGERGDVRFKDIVNIEQSTLNQDKRKCDGESEIDPKSLYNSIVNDPALKNAFYKQPSFWNYLVAIVKGTKPRGKGLVSAAEIVSDYKRRNIYEKIGEDFNNFVENKILSYKLIDPNQLIFKPSTKNGKQIVLNRIDTYKAKVLPIKFDDESLTIEDETNDILIIIDSKIKNEIKGYRFNVRFIKKYDNGDEKEYEAVIKILDIKGSGYDKEQNKNTK